MGQAVGQSLPFAAGLAVSPFPLVAMVLILGTRHGRVNGPVFALASILGIAVVGAVVLALSGDDAATDSGAPAAWVTGLRLALGLLLLAYAAKGLFRRPPAGAEPALPAWMRALESLTAIRAAGMGLVLSALNPKNLALAVAGAAAIAQAEPPPGQAAGALAIMVAIGTLGVTVPLAMTLALGARGVAALESVKDWMVRNNGVIMAVVALIFGASLVGDAIAGFSA